jgi:site-specific recombinase XerD
MPNSTVKVSPDTMPQGGDLAVNAGRFRRHIRAVGLSPRTEHSYLESVGTLARFLAERGMPLDTAAITREHLEEWLIQMDEAGRKPATRAIRYRSVQQFFRWALEEGLLKVSPMANMRPPRIPDAPPSVLRDEQLAAVLKVVETDRTFAGRRDAAIIRLFIASGARLSEIANLRWTPAEPSTNDVDLDGSLIRVIGKGNRERPIYVGAKAAKALDRYIFDQRARHRFSDSQWLWLAPRGRLTSSGIAQLIKARGDQAGIGGLHPHAFRHAWAHTNLARGMQEGEVMTLAGWRSREMLRRYAASTATDRALEAARRAGLADRL